MRNPFGYLNSSPKIIRLAVMMFAAALQRSLIGVDSPRECLDRFRSVSSRPVNQTMPEQKNI